MSSLTGVVDVYVRLHGAGSRTIHRHSFLHGLFHFVPVKCVHVAVIQSTTKLPYSCQVTSTGSLDSRLVKVPLSSCIKYLTDRLRTSFGTGISCLLSIVRNDIRGRASICFRHARHDSRYVICSPRGSRIITLFLSSARAVHTRETLSHDRGLFGGVFTGVPTKIRVCSGSNCLLSLGG